MTLTELYFSSGFAEEISFTQFSMSGGNRGSVGIPWDLPTEIPALDWSHLVQNQLVPVFNILDGAALQKSGWQKHSS